MALILRVLAGPPGDNNTPRAERTIELDDHLTEIRLGRRAGLEVELPFPALSSIHARLSRRAGAGWVVEDLGSANGSWLGGVRLQLGRAVAIAPGSILRLADVSVRFEGAGPATSSATGPARPEGTATIARRLVSDLFQARASGEAPRLVGVGSSSASAGASPGASAGASAGLPWMLRLTIPDRAYLVGRGETCDLVLPSEEISREHAVLTRRWEGVHIRDLDSKNGISIAGQPITGEREHRLRDGDQVAIGPLLFGLEDPEDRYLRQIEAAPEAAAAPVPAPASHDPAALSSPAALEAGGANRGARPHVVNLPIIVGGTVLVAVAIVTMLLIFGS